MKLPGTIAFINPKSGGKHGTKLYLKLCVILGEDHVFDLSKGGPESGYVEPNDGFPFYCPSYILLTLLSNGNSLRKFSKCENLKVIACGGDGTVVRGHRGELKLCPPQTRGYPHLLPISRYVIRLLPFPIAFLTIFYALSMFH